MTALLDLCRAAVDHATSSEEVECYAEEVRRFEILVDEGEVEAASNARTVGVGIRLVTGGRIGHVYHTNPSVADLGPLVVRARAAAAMATPSEAAGLPDPSTIRPVADLHKQGVEHFSAEDKIRIAVDLEAAATRGDPRVRRAEETRYGDAVSHVAIASTTGIAGEYSRTDCWCSVTALASSGDAQSAYAFAFDREPAHLDWEGCAADARERAIRVSGGKTAPTGRMPVVLDPFASVEFVEALVEALEVERMESGRSALAGMVGEQVAASSFSVVDDGRMVDGPLPAPFDDEGVSTRSTTMIEHGRLQALLHNSASARRYGAGSTGNGRRTSFRTPAGIWHAAYKTPPSVSPTNLTVAPGDETDEELLRRADGGLYVQEMWGAHSGVDPVSGEFSVAGIGTWIRGGELGEAVAPFTLSGMLPEMLRSIGGTGRRVRFPRSISIGSPLLLVSAAISG